MSTAGKENEDQEQCSLLPEEIDEEADILPQELSGDQNAQQSILVSHLQSHKANFLLTVATISKTVIGSGILTIPYTMRQLGYIFGSLVFIFAAVLIQFACLLLLRAKNLSRHSNFSTIFYELWRSRIGKGLGNLIIFLTGLGVCIAEMIIFKQTIRKIITDFAGVHSDFLDSFFTQQYFIVLVMALLETPLTLVSKIQRLKIMAFIGVSGIVTFMLSFVVFFIVAALDSNPDNDPVGDMQMFPEKWFGAAATVPNVILSVSYQLNFFPIFKGMKNVNDSKMGKASACAVAFCTSSYLLIGILGYFYVGSKAQANFLNSLPYQKIQPAFFLLINLSFLLSIFFAFPIMFFSCRNNFIAIVKLIVGPLQSPKVWRTGDEIQQIGSYIRDEGRKERKRKARLHFIGYTVLIYLAIVGLAMGLQDIEVVFNAVGAICSSSTGALLPAFFYVGLVRLKKQRRGWRYIMALLILLLLTPYCLFSIVALYIQPE